MFLLLWSIPVGGARGCGWLEWSRSRGDCVGMSQESVQGPWLFLIYFHDLALCAADTHFILLANDITRACSVGNSDIAVGISGNAISRAKKWFSVIKLFINASKTQALGFSSRNSHEEESVESVTFLGIHLDYGGFCKLAIRIRASLMHRSNCKYVLLPGKF